MSPRFLAFFLSIVLSWSAVVTHGPSIDITTVAQAQTLPPAAAHDASMDDHPRGDLPAQAHETSADLPALVTLSPAVPGLPTSAGPWPGSVAALPAPYLDAPRRPPRAGRSAA